MLIRLVRPTLLNARILPASKYLVGSFHSLRVIVAFAIAGCCSLSDSLVANEPSLQEGEKKLPAKPFDLPKPADPKHTKVKDIDLTEQDEDELKLLARELAKEEDWKSAKLVQQYIVFKHKDGQYDLACYHFQCKEIDEGLYWLQVAATEEGVDTDWASKDADLTSMRADPRWKKVKPFLVECGEYWKTSKGVTLLSLPANYKSGTEVPALVWLHGYGSSPHGLASGETGQVIADRLNAAVIGVSATNPAGKKSFVWAEELEADFARINRAVEEVSDRVKVAPGKLVALGFSQGGMVAATVAAGKPDKFAGAIILSPGGKNIQVKFKPNKTLHAKQHYFLSVGKGELGNAMIASMFARQLKTLGAKVESRVVKEQDDHTLPPDFIEKIPEWFKTMTK